MSVAEHEERIVRALQVLHDRTRHQDLLWVIIGSASLWLQEVDIVPEDIDVLASKESAVRMTELLQDFETRPLGFSRSGRYESHFGQYEILGVKLEIMANLRILIDGRWEAYSDRLERRVWVNVRGMQLPVSSLADHLASYEGMNRQGDEEKVRKIRESLGRRHHM